MEQIKSRIFAFKLVEQALYVTDKRNKHAYPPVHLSHRLDCACVHPSTPILFTISYSQFEIDIWDLITSQHRGSISLRAKPSQFLMSHSGRFAVVVASSDSEDAIVSLMNLESSMSLDKSQNAVEVPFDFEEPAYPKVYFSNDERYLYLIWDDTVDGETISAKYQISTEATLSVSKPNIGALAQPDCDCHPHYYPEHLESFLDRLAILEYGQYFE